MLKNKKFWKAALVRALKTVAHTLLGVLPVGFTVTPVMLQHANWSTLWTILAWLATGLLSGVMSILTSIVSGLPEVDKE